MRFKSRVDWWYYLAIIISAVVVIIAVLPAIQNGQLSPAMALFILLLALAIPIWLLWSTDYRVIDETLRVRSGPFYWSIPLNEIRGVNPSRSLIASPALSLDRLAIHYGSGKKLLVSPADKASFLQAIRQDMHLTD